jgi:nucleobase:cation symporter-1, NCS1 family
LSRTAVDEAVNDDRPFRLERRGIDFIPGHERWAKPRDLFSMWAGASLQVENFVYGVVLMTFGFSFAQAAILTVLGNCSYLLLGLASLQGPQTGTTTFVINRAGFGPSGSRLLAFFNWLTMVGFETEGLILIVFAGEALAIRAGLLPGTPLRVALIVGATAIQLVLPLLGHASIVRALRWLTIPFLVLYVLLAVFTLHHADLSVDHVGAGWETFMGGLAFVIVLSGLGWAECGNDYSRYLPSDASRRSIVCWVVAGTALPQIALMLLGCAVGTYTAGALAGGDPFQAFVTPHVHVFATGFVTPFLLVGIVQLFAVNSLDLYSSGVTLQALGIRIARWQAVFVDTAICLGLTSYAVFDSSFSTLLKDFVDLVVVWIAPWIAIFLTDWALRHFRYSSTGLQQSDPRSPYYGSHGISWPGIIAQFIGMAAAIECLAADFQMPAWLHAANFELGGHLPGDGADFSVFAGMAAAALAYTLLFALNRSRRARFGDAPVRDQSATPFTPVT